jgi:hypothetical protein
MKKIKSFVITKIKRLDTDEIELHSLVDNKPNSFIISFNKDQDGKYLGFTFRSDLEMLCRANDLIFVRSLMEFLANYRNGQNLALPFSVQTQSKELQTA